MRLALTLGLGLAALAAASADAAPQPPLFGGTIQQPYASRPRPNPYVSQPGAFRPYGVRSGLIGGGPSAYPRAPKPPGYIDIYGRKSPHPFGP